MEGTDRCVTFTSFTCFSGSPENNSNCYVGVFPGISHKFLPENQFRNTTHTRFELQHCV